MFTGIVTQRATVVALSPGAGPAVPSRLRVELERPIAAAVGDSVALDGVCLTVVAAAGARLEFDVVPETLRRTTLSCRRPGDRCNVEAALRAGDPLGGHLVQGHVDGVATVAALDRRGPDVRLVLDLPEGLRGCAVEKGSIAVDGVSLTVGEAEEDRVAVYLVPHTLAATGLSERRPGDLVNVEADLVGRWVEHHVRRALAAPREEARR